MLDTLTDREENVLRLRFGLDDGRTRTLEEVGRVFGVTRERIRQIEAKALRKLRHPSRRQTTKRLPGIMHNRAGGQTVLLPFNETESREPNERRATIEATRKWLLHNKNERIADIGSDHAYLPCFAVKNQTASFAIAGEVVDGPFNLHKNKFVLLA
ncbi:hypothetical protein GCM10027614_83260 [Micromonospora vulcania]